MKTFNNPTICSWLFVSLLGVIWGGSFLMAKLALLGGIGPIWIAFGRLFIGGIFLTVLAIFFGSAWPKRNIWGFVIAAAFLSNALPFSLLNWAQQYIESATTGVFMAIIPLFTLFLAHNFLSNEKMTGAKTIGFLLGFVGIAILIGLENIQNMDWKGMAFFAQLACLVSAFCYASGAVAMKRAPKTDFISFSAATLLVAASGALPIAILWEPWPQEVTMTALLPVFGLGILSTGLAMLLLFKIISWKGPNFLAIVNYQVPIWSVIFGTLVLQETLNPRLGIALIFILAGIGISQNIWHMPLKFLKKHIS